MKGMLEFIYKFAHAVNLAHGGYPIRIHFEQSNPSGQYSKTSLILCSWACCFGDWKRKLDRKIDLTNHSITSFWRFDLSFILETRWTGDDALSTWEPLEGPNGLVVLLSLRVNVSKLERAGWNRGLNSHPFFEILNYFEAQMKEA